VLPSLAKAGYFDAGSKIGILLADDGSGNNQRLVDQIWKPQLAAMNLSPSVFKVSYANSTSSLSNISSQYNSAILQFQTAGVNHVLFTPDTGTATFLFPPAAESQHFRPRYAMTTHNYPAAMSGAPQGQADRSMAVSWSVEDVSDAATPTAKIPGIGSTAERRHCDQLYTKYAAANATPTSAFYPWCDFLGLLKKALATTTTVPTAASLLKGIEAVGSGFEPAMSYGPALFGPKHYDGGSFMRVVKFDPAAKAYKLGSPAARIP
jgi:hypothetical protein